MQGNSTIWTRYGEPLVCPYCGESWDLDTPGYREAFEYLLVDPDDNCPSCEKEN